MKTVKEFDFGGKRALVRVDFNVPLSDQFEIKDDTRIQAALPTLKKILEDEGSLVIMSHLGRPKKGPEHKYSLEHLVGYLSECLGTEVQFAEDCISESAFSMSAGLGKGKVLLLNNLRFYAEETQGDQAFAKTLSGHGEVYVNDAFGTAHRAHASTAVIADSFSKENKMFGYLMSKEIQNAERVFSSAEKPFTAILGGAKVSGKILIIERLLDKADHIIIGGGMAYTFFEAMGGSVGKSLVEKDRLEMAKDLIQKAKDKGVQLHLPEDSIVADQFANTAKTQVVSNMSIEQEWMGLDIGPNAIKAYSEVILASKTILWNGPMGVFELSNFKKGTVAIAQAIAEATKNGAYSLVGGGDSVAAVNQFGFADRVSYVSTGGGAMLEFFEGKELPGIMALK